MKKSAIFLLLLALFVWAGQAQVTEVEKDTAKIVIGEKGKLTYKGSPIAGKPLKDLLYQNPVAKSKAQGANVVYIFGLIAAGAGGGMLGSELGAGQITSTGLIFSVSSITVGLLSAVVSTKMMRKAVEIYNRDVGNGPVPKLAWRIGAAQHGFGMTLTF